MQDDAHWLERYQQLWTQHHDKQVTTRELVSSVLSVSEHWEQDLTLVNGLVDQGCAGSGSNFKQRHARGGETALLIIMPGVCRVFTDHY